MQSKKGHAGIDCSYKNSGIIMHPLRLTVLLITAIATFGLQSGCAPTPRQTNEQGPNANLDQFQAAAADKIVLFFYRMAGYSGGGRIHILKIDHQEIGEVTADNYYRIELWPGEYHMTVFLPLENFYGQTNPPALFSERIIFRPSDGGSSFAYQFIDGMGTRGFKLTQLTGPPAFLSRRTLAKSLSARETAQVTELLNARYDGPATNGRPHGMGTLTWLDGSQFRGVFEYGVPTNRAKFFFSNGQVFTGLFHNGRPGNEGILMTPAGHILFAGKFVDEQPHGVGLRNGNDAPEYCLFDHGQDITKTFDQLAKEALDVEDPGRINAFSNRISNLTDSINAENDRMAQLTEQAGTIGDNQAALEEQLNDLKKSIRWLEQTRKRWMRHAEKDRRQLIETLRATRSEREFAKTNEFKRDHRAKIEAERTWCKEELSLGRHVCGCAPLVADFNNWQACEGRHE
jgi:hypothetical protein